MVEGELSYQRYFQILYHEGGIFCVPRIDYSP